MGEWVEWREGNIRPDRGVLIEVRTVDGTVRRGIAGAIDWSAVTAYRSAPSIGVKHDQGKPMAGLMLTDFSRALEAVASVTTFGAGKYSPSGWLAVPEAERRYTDALCRHLLADLRGEATDAESGQPHLAHAAWNALAVLGLRLRGGG